MNTRFLVSISALILLLGANAFLLRAEDFEVRSLKVVKTIDDPLAGLKYDGSFETVLKRMGIPENLRQSILIAVKKIDRQYGKRLESGILKSERKAQLAEDLCGLGVLPRRYMLLESLVRQGNGGRRVLPLGQVQFEVQDWFVDSNVAELHERFERKEGAPSDATARILAAVLADKESDFLNSKSLWSRNDWDWDRLFKGHAQLEDKLIEFSALGLVVLQRAQKALCGGE
jgi:hypothetical protein